MVRLVDAFSRFSAALGRVLAVAGRGGGRPARAARCFRVADEFDRIIGSEFCHVYHLDCSMPGVHSTTLCADSRLPYMAVNMLIMQGRLQ